ncbi:OmpA family protein [Uliginosibacterium gangwonense]|uniref:OmpA family protein n=1 Tax=Uliginosibacterium gangwonense TaxID=392736 RepID=UPI00037EFEC5|nr:OmpA family protein [Uliginosibacterium gangwonense]
MKKSYSFVLAVIAASLFSAGAQAQSSQIRIDKNGVIPYAIDGNGIVERSSSGLCWRAASIWSKELALSVKTLDGDKLPVGCYCDADQLPKEACQAAPEPVKTPEPVKAPEPVQAPVKAPEPVAAPTALPSAEKVTIPADALFAFDKAELMEQGKEALAAFADTAKNLKQLEVVIAVGHADRIGSDAYNQKLSEKRAATVKDFLISQGLPANKVYTEGKGKSQPKTGDDYKKLGALNGKNKKMVDFFAPDRRVELEAVGSK